MKLYLVFIVSTFTLHAHFYHITTDNFCAYIAIIPPMPTVYTADTTHAIITECFFTMPQFFEQAMQEKKPVLLLVSDQLDHLSPIALQAPWIEGARVALAWARCYMFTTYPALYIMYIPPSYLKNPLSLIQSALHLIAHVYDDTVVYTEPVDIQKHLFHFNALFFTADYISYEMQEVSFTCNAPGPLVIHPPLKPQVSGQLRFVLTGGAGFIGKHLTQALLEKEHQVIVLDNFASSTPDNIAHFDQNPNFFFVHCDITRPFTVEGPVDYVLHCASLPSPVVYYTRPHETLMTGLHGTLYTLELARIKNARYFFASTSEVYGDPTIHPQPEWYPGNVNPIGKRSSYDESKRGAETLITWYVNKYHLDVRIARIFNTYGPCMQLYDGRVITNFIRAALYKESMTIYGEGKQTRSFCYVTDTVQGIIRLLEAQFDTISITDRIFNIGNPLEEYTIQELAHKINTTSQMLLNSHVPIIHITQPDETDPHVRRPDMTRAKQILNFSPQITLAEGLEKTFQFFIENNPVQLKFCDA